ncbi:MAG TPA: ABC transporter substrate-binding protein, partial [Polyangiales bacterium]|nr:ABC transporter substrate-binding protein [Polyangiales bacterium]
MTTVRGAIGSDEELASSGNLRGSQRLALVLLLGPLLPLLGACSAERRADPDELVVLLPRDVQELDPRFVSDAYGLKISRLLFASLVTIDPATLEVMPDLAERVDVVSPSEYRIVLRAGLTFSDGSVLDADDVVATYRSVVDPALATRYAPSYQRIASLQALDARTVVFRLDGPHATFLTDLELPILRAEDAKRHLGVLGAAEPIGAGPYRLAQRVAGRLTLRANSRWYAGKPKFPKLRMLVVRDDNIRTLRMLSGAGDLTLNGIPSLLLPLFAHGGFEVSSARGTGTTYMGVNTQAGPLADVRVRQAIAHAIDR